MLHRYSGNWSSPIYTFLGLTDEELFTVFSPLRYMTSTQALTRIKSHLRSQRKKPFRLQCSVMMNNKLFVYY